MRTLDRIVTDHPAKYSEPILRELHAVAVDEKRRLGRWPLTLDPFAGVGRIHRVQPEGTVGVELEPEWAACHSRTICGNVLALPFADSTFDAVMTSPVYGNRMSDHHNAADGSKRRTYKHTLGRDLHPDNAGQLHWGPAYREFHEAAWAEVVRVLGSRGLLVLNVSDHIADHRVEIVVPWHAMALGALGCTWVRAMPVRTPRYKNGENAAARVDHECVIVMRGPE